MPKGKHKNHPKGSNHPRWNRGEITSTEGYIKIRVGTTHPLADPNGYAYEHHVVWAAAGHKPPKDNELIHHINHDRKDNRLENLEIMTRSLHNKHHNRDKKRNELGQFATK